MVLIVYLITLIMVSQDFLVAATGFSIFSIIDELVVVLVAIFSIFAKKPAIKKQRMLLTCLLLLFAATGILSCIIHSNYTVVALLSSCFLSLKFWILLLAISRFNSNKKLIEVVYNSIFLAEAIVITIALVNILFPAIYHSVFTSSIEMYRFGLRSICSTFDHPGKYGWFMLFCAIAHLSKYHSNRSKKELIRIIIAVIACVLSLRTKVIMGVIFCLAAYFFIVNRENIRKQIKKILVFAVVIMCILIPLHKVIEKTYMLYFTDKEGYSVRQALADNSVKIAKEYMPIGVGFGKYGSWYASKNYSEYYYKYRMSRMYGLMPNDSSYATDTFWPSLLGETGLLGSLLYIIMLLVLYRWLAGKNNRAGNGAKIASISLYATLALIQMIIESFGSASFYGPPGYFFSAAIIGIALMDKNNTREIAIRKEQ